MSNEALNGQYWDRYVGNQSADEFMRYAGTDVVESAVRDYIQDLIAGGDFPMDEDDPEEVIAALAEKIHNDHRNAVVYQKNGAPRDDGNIWDALTYSTTVDSFLEVEPRQDTIEATVRAYVRGLSHSACWGEMGRFDARTVDVIVGAMLRVIEDAGVTL